MDHRVALSQCNKDHKIFIFGHSNIHCISLNVTQTPDKSFSNSALCLNCSITLHLNILFWYNLACSLDDSLFQSPQCQPNCLPDPHEIPQKPSENPQDPLVTCKRRTQSNRSFSSVERMLQYKIPNQPKNYLSMMRDKVQCHFPFQIIFCLP